MKTLKEVKEKLEDIRGGGVDNKELNSYTEYNNLFFIENYKRICKQTFRKRNYNITG